MNFSNLLEIKELVFSLPRKETYSDDPLLFDGGFQPIKIDSFDFFIMASDSNYCNPKENFTSLKEYNQVQIHIEEFLEKDRTTALVIPSIDERFIHFDWKKYFCYQDSAYRIIPSYIGIHVPIKAVFQIIKDIKKVARLRTFF